MSTQTASAVVRMRVKGGNRRRVPRAGWNGSKTPATRVQGNAISTLDLPLGSISTVPLSSPTSGHATRQV